MVPGVVGSSPITHPTRRTGIGSDPNPCFLFSTQGCRQVVRQGTLTPSSAGSSPAIPARQQRMTSSFIYASLAQSAEHLPFKQGVRGSNPRRGTKKANRKVGFFARRGGDSKSDRDMPMAYHAASANVGGNDDFRLKNENAAEQLDEAPKNANRKVGVFSLLYSYPNATSSTIITEKPTVKKTVPMLEWPPSLISGISSSTTTYSMAPAAKAST